MKYDSKDLVFACQLQSKGDVGLVSLGMAFLNWLRKYDDGRFEYREPSNRFYPTGGDKYYGVQIQRECLHITVRGELDRFEPWKDIFEIKPFRGDTYWGFHLRDRKYVQAAVEMIKVARTKIETEEEREQARRERQALKMLQGMSPDELAAVLAKAQMRLADEE